MKVLLLLALVGFALGLTPGMEYKYKYEGRLGHGIPEIRNKFSGVGIRATVTLQFQGEDATFLKLSDVEVGECVGDAGAKVTNPLPIEFTSLKTERNILEQPFQVFFKKDNNHVMVVPEPDVEWIVNIRKSIAHLFLIEPIRGHYGPSEVFSSEDFTRKAFSIDEPTIFGTCSVDYAIRPFEFKMTHDVPKDIPVHDDEDTFFLTRTINFNKCSEKVRLLITSFEEFEGISDNLFGNVGSRSSVMTVKFVGKPGNYKIHEGNVQGYFSVNPFAVPSDKLMSMSNQTYFLESVTPIHDKFVVPTPSRIINTWYMEVASPFAPPQNPTTFVNYHNEEVPATMFSSYSAYTGVPLNPSQFKEFQTSLDKIIEEASTLMFDIGTIPKGISPVNTNEGKLTTFLHTAYEMANSIDVQGLQELFDKYYNDNSENGQMKLRLFIDVLAASGYGSPMKVLLDEMQKHRISPERITSIFMTFSNNFMATQYLPEFMAFVKSLDFETHPFMTTNVYINFASILKKVCFMKETTPYQFFGRYECNPRIITEDFVPFLIKKFENSKEPHERTAIIQTLGNLGTPEAAKFLSSVIAGDFDIRIREMSVLVFHFRNFKGVMEKDEVFNILMPIVENTREDELIRQDAIYILLTWNPSPSWWYRLATSTWKEPSENVGSLIYYLIKSNYYSNGIKFNEESSRVSHFLLPLTKPFPETKSFNFLYNKQYDEAFTNAFFKFSVFKDHTSNFPKSFYNRIDANYGGLPVPLVETAFTMRTVEDSDATMMEQITEMIPEQIKNFMKKNSNKRAEEVFTEFKKHLKSTFMNEENSHPESRFFLRFLANNFFMASFSPKTFPTTFNTNTFEFLKSMASGKNLHISKFFNPTQNGVFFPTEIGLPFEAHMTTPTVFAGEGNVKLNFDLKSFNVDLNTDFKFASKIHTSFMSIVPWSKKVISSGVEKLVSFKFPCRFRVGFETQKTFFNVSMSVIPSHDKEFVAFYTHTIPFVSKTDVFPGPNIPKFDHFEVVTVKGKEEGMHHNKYVVDKDYYGIDSAMFYEGDVPFPFTTGNIYDHFNYPYKMFTTFVSPTSKLSMSAFVFNFGTSDTKAFYPSVAFSFPFFFKGDNVMRDHKGDYTDDEDDTKTFIVRLLTTGKENRFFESNYNTKVISREADVKRTQIFYRSATVLPRTKPQVFCVQMETRQPSYYDFHALLNQLNSRHMDFTFAGKVRGGTSCDDAQFATIKGEFKVSNEKKTFLEDEIKKELHFNQKPEVDFDEMSVYDQTSFLVEYKEPLPAFFTNMTYNTYDIFRGSQFPHTYHNYYNVKNSKGRIYVEGDRYTDGAWNIRAELPTENINMDHFQVPLFYSFQYMFFGNMNFGNVFFGNMNNFGRMN